ncbi:MAG: coiled-coil protein [Candidatus Odinarchaeota archaeon]
MAEESAPDKDEFGSILEQLRKVQAAMRVCVRAIQDSRNQAWEWRDRRDELRAEAPQIHDEISVQRDARDELNVEVQRQKELRDKETDRARELQDELNELRGKRRGPEEYVSLEDMQREFRELEWKQQTTSLTVDEEKAVIEEMERLSKAIASTPKDTPKPADLTEEMEKRWQEIQEARNKAQEHHEKMVGLVEEAQLRHKSVIQLSQNLDPARTEAGEAHQMYVQCLQEADEMRERLDELREQELTLKAQLDTIRKSRKETRREREKAAMERLAEQARTKQQSGQKLTLQEMRALMETNGLE